MNMLYSNPLLFLSRSTLMKKTVLTMIFAGLTVAATANANWYAQGDLALSNTKFSEYSSLDDTKFHPRFSIGYDMGNLRLAADYTHHGKFSANEKGKYISSKIYGLGFSAIYDFSVSSPFKPYAGVRVAQNVFKIEHTRPGYFSDNTDNKLGYGVIAGAQYQFAPRWLLNGGVEYNRLGKFDDTKVNHYGLNIGVRFNF